MVGVVLLTVMAVLGAAERRARDRAHEDHAQRRPRWTFQACGNRLSLLPALIHLRIEANPSRPPGAMRRQ
jgi:hypothetical protein